MSGWTVPAAPARTRMACVLLGVCAGGGCADSEAGVQRTERPRGIERTTPAEPAWKEGVRIGGSADDSTLLIPMQPVANERGLFVTDIAGHRVTHFDHEGRVVWTFGRQGQGPGEFESPRDIRLDARGRVWVLDTRIMRVTVLSPDGQLERMMALNVWDSPNEILPLADGTAMVALGAPTLPFARIDSLGNAISRHPFPWEAFASLHRLSSQFITAHDPVASEWVSAFRVGDGFFHFKDAEWKRYVGWYAEPVEFPVPVVTTEGNLTTSGFAERPVSAAISVTLSPERLYVLFGGTTEWRARVVDTFSRRDGRYQGSFLLPQRSGSIVWHDGGFYVYRSRPFPELVYLRADQAFP